MNCTVKGVIYKSEIKNSTQLDTSVDCTSRCIQLLVFACVDQLNPPLKLGVIITSLALQPLEPVKEYL